MMAEEFFGECREEEQITVGLVDAMITCVRVLKTRDLSGPPVQGALEDFFNDPELQILRDALQTT